MPFYADWFRLTMFWRYGDGLPYLRKDRVGVPGAVRQPDQRPASPRRWPTSSTASSTVGRTCSRSACRPTRRTASGSRSTTAGSPPFASLTSSWSRTRSRFTTTGIVVDGVERPADIVAFATGFQTMQFAARLDIRGRGGRSRDEWLPDDASAHLGLTVPGFPNFFCLVGPTTGLGHGGSLIFVIECQARYICSALSHLTRTGATAMEVRQEVHDEYRNRADAEHEQLIWTHPGMTNWYRNSAGRVVALMPWRLVDYWNMTHDFDPSEYEVTGAVQPAT
ncbi:MAG: hypothetical protein R2705_01730 [Ilumatobacteraceae bacterium]